MINWDYSDVAPSDIGSLLVGLRAVDLYNWYMSFIKDIAPD
jgi:hypothetical protein